MLPNACGTICEDYKGRGGGGWVVREGKGLIRKIDLKSQLFVFLFNYILLEL